MCIYTRAISPRSLGNDKAQLASSFLEMYMLDLTSLWGSGWPVWLLHREPVWILVTYFTSSHLWAGPITSALVLSHWWRGLVKHLFNIPWLRSQSRSPKQHCASSLWQGASSYQLQVGGVLFQRSSQFDTSFSYMSTCLCSLQYLPSARILDKLNTGTSDGCLFLICLDGSNNLNRYQRKNKGPGSV